MPMINDYYKQMKTHIISTQRERLTYGFRVPEYPTHDGMDFTDADRLERTKNVNILAFEDGVVALTGYGQVSGLGYYIDIRHEFISSAEGNNGKKYLTRYCHMKYATTIKVGQSVKKGDILGIIGKTGNSTAPHLHFGLKENSKSWDTGAWVDPAPYLTGAKSMRTTLVALVYYSVQIGRFAAKERAQSLADELGVKGYAAFVAQRIE